MKKLFILLLVFQVVIDFCATAQPLLQWPLDRNLYQGLFFMMHYDNNKSAGTMQDYRCNDQYVYDGHTGTDITAYNFRLMDEGIAILAAGDGVVGWEQHDQFDRNYWPPYQGEANGLNILHSGGLLTEYWHLRTNSVAVKIGEQVKAGQFLAMVGSSGATPIPHLHFEIKDRVGNTSNFVSRDPFHGVCGSPSGAWANSYHYPGDTALRILDADIFNNFSIVGNEANNFFGETALKDRPIRPRIYGANESKLGFWVAFQGSPNERYLVQVYRPDGSLFIQQNKIITTKRGIQWHVFTWNWNINNNDFGKWAARILYKDQEVLHTDFEVGPQTLYTPRFYPIAGKSFRLSNVNITDQFSVSGGVAPIQYQLINAPSGITLQNNKVTISPQTATEYRNTFFQVIATDAMGFSDTMRYHLIDFSKLINPVVITPIKDIKETLNLSVFPNPAKDRIELFYTLKENAVIKIQLLDMHGKKIIELPETEQLSGRHQQSLQISSLPAGIYLLQLYAGAFLVTEKLIIE
ncbi:MAG: peptidoglycan DD-metalloendopeptidase family protein [Saprospiraceae bacterium]|nr:peptidoglycan DD-metalloendopeptidase family protein [Saprospiraceae bacterium]